jgi:hypothetical protein
MKKLIILTLLHILLSGSFSYAQKDFQRFYNKHRNDAGVESFEMSTSLFRFLLKDQETDSRLLNNINRVSLFMSESASPVLRNSLYSHLPKRMYKDLMEVHTERSGISFKIRETRDGIEELLLIADEGASLFVLSITGFLSFEEAAALAGSVDVGVYRE